MVTCVPVHCLPLLSARLRTVQAVLDLTSHSTAYCCAGVAEELLVRCWFTVICFKCTAACVAGQVQNSGRMKVKDAMESKTVHYCLKAAGEGFT